MTINEIKEAISQLPSDELIEFQSWYEQQMAPQAKGVKNDLRQTDVRVHHDLDYLAGTWTEEEALEFAQATEAFEQVDPDLW